MKYLQKINDFGVNEQTVFNTAEKRILADKMDDILIDFNRKYHDIKKYSEIRDFLKKSMDDIYHEVLNIKA